MTQQPQSGQSDGHVFCVVLHCAATGRILLLLLNVSCRNLMTHVKKLTWLRSGLHSHWTQCENVRHSYTQSGLGLGQRGTGEEVHSCLVMVQNNWPGVSAPMVLNVLLINLRPTKQCDH